MHSLLSILMIIVTETMTYDSIKLYSNEDAKGTLVSMALGM